MSDFSRWPFSALFSFRRTRVAGFSCSLLLAAFSALAADPAPDGLSFMERSKPAKYQSAWASSFLGAEGMENAVAIQIAMDGSVYIAGSTSSVNFPVTRRAFQTAQAGAADVFVCKLDPAAKRIIAATFLGGSGGEEATALFIAADGDVYVAGSTASADFPCTPGAFDSVFNGGNENPYTVAGDAFVARFCADLSTLEAATFLGGAAFETARGVQLDGSGAVLVAGTTASANFPATQPAFDRTYNGGNYFRTDGYAARFDHDLTRLEAATFVGGTRDDWCEDLALDAGGRLYLSFWVASRDFPVTANAYCTSYRGHYYDGAVTCLSSGLDRLEASTYLGGSSWDFAYGLALDKQGRVYVTGHTASVNFPVTAGCYQPAYRGIGGPDEGDDMFVSRLSADLSALEASTFLGGTAWEWGVRLAVNPAGSVFLAGTSSSMDFPVTPHAFQGSRQGGDKYTGETVLCRFDADLRKLAAGTYLGAQGDDFAQGLAIDRDGRVYVTGSTNSAGYPVSDRAFQDSRGGGSDAFYTRLDRYLCAGPACFSPGDLDGNRHLTMLDVLILAFHLQGFLQPGTHPFTSPGFVADVNDDSVVNQQDMRRLMELIGW